jgi:hypothetical protein
MDTLDPVAPERAEPRDDRYPFSATEAKWQEEWDRRRTFATDRTLGHGEPFYASEIIWWVSSY